MKIDPRMDKVLTAARRGSIFIGIVASLSAIGLFINVLGIGIISFFIAMFSAWIITYIGNMLYVLYLQKKYYNSNLEEFIKDADFAEKYYKNASDDDDELQNTNDLINITVEAQSVSPIGKYMDADIFDWMDVKMPDGIVRRFKFHSTADIKNSDNIFVPENCILFPPGIIYQVESV